MTFVYNGKDKVHFTWKRQSTFDQKKDKVHFKRQSTFYLEKTKNILPGKDKVLLTWKKQSTFYLENTKYFLPGKDKVHFTWPGTSGPGFRVPGGGQREVDRSPLRCQRWPPVYFKGAQV